MSVNKRPNGKWRVQIKQHGSYLPGLGRTTFDTKKEAEAAERRFLASLAGGIDPRSGQIAVGELVPEWIRHRETTVAFKTAQGDRNSFIWLSPLIEKLGVGQVTTGQIAENFGAMARDGKARATITRFRATLRSFFGWCVDNKYIATNPVIGVKVPKVARASKEMRPYSRAELQRHLVAWRELDEECANMVAFMAATGLRWSEMRELKPSDVRLLPYPVLIVSRAQPENAPVKGTKSGKSRRVPVAIDVLHWLGHDADLAALERLNAARLPESCPNGRREDAPE
ncbi:MAG: hypothetical protein FWG11_00105 [Promicromonosporaceae bacterium]|nr:hypothetical protein [Promicromonosporaceae bacterium]